MNNLEDWREARKNVHEAWKCWKPHFEILESETKEKMIAFFLLDNTSIEWELYQEVPEDSVKDFADYMEEAKEEILEQIGFDCSHIEQETLTEQIAQELSTRLEENMMQYEKRTGLKLSDLTFNMLFYSEWSALPEELLEERYSEE